MGDCKELVRKSSLLLQALIGVCRCRVPALFTLQHRVPVRRGALLGHSRSSCSGHSSEVLRLPDRPQAPPVPTLRRVPTPFAVCPLQVPAGVDSGSRLRVRGEGNAGKRGGEPGDLYVYISVKEHPELRRDGISIHSDVEISYVDAILGTQVGARRGRTGSHSGCAARRRALLRSPATRRRRIPKRVWNWVSETVHVDMMPGKGAESAM